MVMYSFLFLIFPRCFDGFDFSFSHHFLAFFRGRKFHLAKFCFALKLPFCRAFSSRLFTGVLWLNARPVLPCTELRFFRI